MKRNVLIGLWLSVIALAGIGASRLALSQPSNQPGTTIRINLTEVVQRIRGLQSNQKLSVQQQVQMQRSRQNVQAELTQLIRSQPLQLLKLIVQSPEAAKQLLVDFATESPLTVEQEFEGIQLFRG